ncbi:unnamed protein product [Cryptosporidium hominis]|uniref:Uncharacterized protein n=1 Tax=Cryptosporidium hominis TaxID=237895 RepID=A0A0S4TM87_CRYHO|nr:hypothetical protein ChTU502y2012_377g0105 [Cryptosporidium hominis]PPA65708.1 hypothetical protein ChUKH1_01005 [Cryptosporidium hominis]PPS98143.1 Uncharacterized protein GY17_00000904 [Cryptosporidium hominis]CUV08009.1 unnamed protein product [Cryptosporidium hominis]|eukprot:PPS98143.1 Uncharacterized protein GY17_00000904 [Cryptosporidium hominis]
MSVTSRTNTLFTLPLPGVSQYTRTGSLNTVVDNSELENNNLDIIKEHNTKRVFNVVKPNKKIEQPEIKKVEPENKKEILCQKKNKNVNYHELEVQLMMKDRMIEELLEENGKLIESMNKIEQDKIDETNRIQQGTEMILQQVVEDNEWYKAQFLEMKNELEKAISQTRNKGREIATLEKRCKNLIEEKETIQNFLDELTVQYDERIYQLQKHNQNICNISQLMKKYLGYGKKVRRHKGKQQDGSNCSISEIIKKIKEMLNVEHNFSEIKYLVDQIELNALNFETEIEELITKFSFKNYNNQNFDENINDQVDFNDHNQSVVDKQNDLMLNNDYEKINNELESAKNEIEQLKFEITRKAELIEELKKVNKNDKLEILDNIDNTKENSKIKSLEEKISILEKEKHELIKKIANMNRSNINKHINNEYINRKLLVITEEGFSSNMNINGNKEIDNHEEEKISIDQSLNIKNSIKDFDKDEKNELNNNDQVQTVSVSDIIDKYIKYPIDYNNGKKQIIQRNSIQRNRYYK